MNNYVVEILTTNRYGGLVDRAIYVKAACDSDAEAKVAAKYPNAAIGFVGLAEGE